MTWSHFLDDPETIFFTDTSVLINLLATGQADVIFSAFSCRFAAMDDVWVELDRGRSRGYQDVEIAETLLKKRYLEKISLGEYGKEIFEKLSDDEAKITLGAGEAATIGASVEYSGIALIDETTATKICQNEFPNVVVVSTAELLLSDVVRNIFKETEMKDILLNALVQGRMQVLPEFVHPIEVIIGTNIADLRRRSFSSNTVRD